MWRLEELDKMKNVNDFRPSGCSITPESSTLSRAGGKLEVK
jgi:hypothetical protein